MALLGSVAFLEWVWPCWRKCVIVEVASEASYAQANLAVDTVPFLFPAESKDAELSALLQHSCLHAATPCYDNSGLHL